MVLHQAGRWRCTRGKKAEWRCTSHHRARRLPSAEDGSAPEARRQEDGAAQEARKKVARWRCTRARRLPKMALHQRQEGRKMVLPTRGKKEGSKMALLYHPTRQTDSRLTAAVYDSSTTSRRFCTTAAQQLRQYTTIDSYDSKRQLRQNRQPGLKHKSPKCMPKWLLLQVHPDKHPYHQAEAQAAVSRVNQARD